MMKCPLCQKPELQQVEIEENLVANDCPQCQGYWITSYNYWNWLKKHGETLPEKPAEVSFDVNDSQGAKLCPQCDRILIKYKVGRGIDFFLDHCNSCNGVWFDRHEWDVLKSRNLHDEVHYIFTKSWQEKIREEEISKNLDAMYEKKLGKDNYQEVQRIRKWLNDHPQRLALLAYLNDENPYQL